MNDTVKDSATKIHREPKSRSGIMYKLYGPRVADAVMARIYELSPKLGDMIENVAYGIFWTKEGLSVSEKSMVTVVALLTMGFDEQIRIHLKGFMNSSKGNLSPLIFALKHIEGDKRLRGQSDYLKTVIDTMQELGFSQSSIDEFSEAYDSFDAEAYAIEAPQVAAMVRLAHASALGNNAFTKDVVSKVMQDSSLKPDQIEGVCLHLIVYCGFPAIMNVYSVLQKLNTLQLQPDDQAHSLPRARL